MKRPSKRAQLAFVACWLRELLKDTPLYMATPARLHSGNTLVSLLQQWCIRVTVCLGVNHSSAIPSALIFARSVLRFIPSSCAAFTLLPAVTDKARRISGRST